MRKLFPRGWMMGGTALLLASASVLAQPAVRVSSKIDTEGSLLGSMMLQVLEANGIKTENKLQLGTTQIMRGAITAGEIDLYPEYTGNGAFFFSDEKNPAWKNATAGYERVKKLAYGFKLNNAQLLTLAGGDTTVTIKAAAQQTSGVNAAMAYGTDGAIAALGLVVLDDPKGIQPIYAPAPVVRAATLAQYPKIRTVLEPVFKTLDGPTLQGLNAKIAVEGQDAKKVSADYLKSKGFIK